MRNKRVLILSQDECTSDDVEKKYKVKEITNSTEWYIGQIISKNEVNRIIQSHQASRPINVKIIKG